MKMHFQVNQYKNNAEYITIVIVNLYRLFMQKISWNCGSHESCLFQ